MSEGHPGGQQFARAVPPVGGREGPAAAHPAREEEPEVLQKMRRIELLDNMRTLAKERRRAKFAGGVAFAVNSLCIRTCDCLAAFLQGVGEAEVARRHGETVQIMEILWNCVRSRKYWDFRSTLRSRSHGSWQESVLRRVGAAHGGMPGLCQPCDEDVAQARWLGSVEGPGSGVVYSGLESTPFLVPLLCALLSPTCKLLPLARMLGRASRGRWCKGDTIFMVRSDDGAFG